MLFAPSSPSRCFIIVKPGGERIGHAWLTVRVSTFAGCTSLYIDDIVIARSHRNQGYGRHAMALLAALALAEGHRSLTWSAVRENVEAHRFYDRLGAARIEGSISFAIDGQGLYALASINSVTAPR
jgi:GNAT superfamily N-acetyltransferase